MNIFLNLHENINNKLYLLNNKKTDSIYFLSSNKINNHFYNKINKANIIYTGFYYNNIDINNISNENINTLLNNIYTNEKFSDNFIKIYKNNYNEYTNINKQILDKLIENIKNTILLIEKHLKFTT